ncbi:beta-1,3-galactosyltransferase 9 [Phyllopteryx taeniolatus]|uniref:beta-1,3-galactosyltransferase 9 n=1 Tax=Phyllopteryx taeniolatus TaxID=161469 RepID=UPI002AD33272|nr:beta-1,3-galactosyltransferase 9 [Phyllopteryx taeniolatus]
MVAINQSWFLCKLSTHQWCFLLFNVLLFHALLFGGDFVEEYLLQPVPKVYNDGLVIDIREKARKLDLSAATEKEWRAYPAPNRDACTSADLFLLALIFSSPANISRRDAIRRTWANQTQVQGLPVRVLFFIGSAHTSHLQEALVLESNHSRDVVQCHAVTDSPFGGPVERTVLAFRWLITFCPRARFVLLTHDHVFVNLPAIGGYLLGLRRHPEDLYLGQVIQGKYSDRNPSSPGYMPPNVYLHKHLPEYCDGTTYVMSQDVVRKVYVASAQVRAPVSADIFVGLCAQKAGVAPTHSARFPGDKNIRYNACCYRYLFSSAQMTSLDLDRVWSDLGPNGSAGKCSLFQTYYGLVICKALTYLHTLSILATSE